MIKVYVEESDGLIMGMFAAEGYVCVENPELADIICYPGGPDVNPALYGDALHRTTRYDRTRDEDFQKTFEIGRKMNVLQVGICGGGQFLNVMSGGKMWQDVDKHAIHGTHDVIYWGEEEPVNVQCTSTHHQMMCRGPGGQTWGWTNISTRRETGGKLKLDNYQPDNEIIWYPHTQSLCFQPHPEYGVEECRELFFTCLTRAMKEAR